MVMFHNWLDLQLVINMNANLLDQNPNEQYDFHVVYVNDKQMHKAQMMPYIHHIGYIEPIDVYIVKEHNDQHIGQNIHDIQECMVYYGNQARLFPMKYYYYHHQGRYHW